MKTKTMNRWLNVLATLAMLTLNGLANGLPLNGYTTGEVSAFYPDLFVPANLTFAIWGLIYVLVLIFVCSAWFARSDGAASDEAALSGPFIVSCIANASWIVAWHYRFVLLSVCIILVLLTSLIVLYQRIGHRAAPWYLRVPISVYLGWVCVATIANITALLVSWSAPFDPATEVVSAVAMVTVATLLAGYLLWRRHDIALALVVAWALIGIRLRTGADTSPTVRHTALIGTVMLSAGALLRSLQGSREGPPRMF